MVGVRGAATRAVPHALQISAGLYDRNFFQHSKRPATVLFKKTSVSYFKRHTPSHEIVRASTTFSSVTDTKLKKEKASTTVSTEEVCDVLETCDTPHVSIYTPEDSSVAAVIPVNELGGRAPAIAEHSEPPESPKSPHVDEENRPKEEAPVLMAQGLLFINLASMLFGTSSVMIKSSTAADLPAEYILPLRFSIAALCFAPQIAKALKDEKMREAGLVSGFWLFVGYVLQAYGLETTSAARGSFCLAFTVLAVPLILGTGGRKIEKSQWIASAVALGGEYTSHSCPLCVL